MPKFGIIAFISLAIIAVAALFAPAGVTTAADGNGSGSSHDTRFVIFLRRNGEPEKCYFNNVSKFYSDGFDQCIMGCCRLQSGFR